MRTIRLARVASVPAVGGWLIACCLAVAEDPKPRPKPKPKAKIKVDYEKDVKPIVEEKCIR